MFSYLSNTTKFHQIFDKRCRRYDAPPVSGLIDQLKDLVVSSVGSWGYLGVFVLMTLESACVPLPSEVTMPVAGLLAAEGKLSFPAVVAIGAVANLIGSWLAYWAGASGGRPFLIKYGRFFLIKARDIDRADRWFSRYGGRAVFFSRLLPIVRTFISLPAGIARMPFGRFSLLTLLGSIPWSLGLAWAGFLLGENWERILPYTEPVSYAVAGTLVLVVTVWVVRRSRAGDAKI